MNFNINLIKFFSIIIICFQHFIKFELTESTKDEYHNGEITANLKLLIDDVGSKRFRSLLDKPNVIKPFGWI